MRFQVIILIFLCGLAYLRFEDTRTWDEYLAKVGVPRSSDLYSTKEIIPIPDPVVAKPFVPPNPLPQQPAWTWAVAGKVYSNVVVKKVEADCVTIVYDEGGARVNISLLPPDVQKLLKYDPEMAAAASAERKKEDATSAALLADEKEKSYSQKQQEIAAEDATATKLAQAEREQNAAIEATMRVEEAKKRLAYYEEDYRHISGGPTVSDSSTQTPGTSPVYTATQMQQMNTDDNGIRECRLIIKNNGYADNGTTITPDSSTTSDTSTEPVPSTPTGPIHGSTSSP